MKSQPFKQTVTFIDMISKLIDIDTKLFLNERFTCIKKTIFYIKAVGPHEVILKIL